MFTADMCSQSTCIYIGIVFTDAGKEEAELMQEWFTLVYEKNALVRYESELMVKYVINLTHVQVCKKTECNKPNLWSSK